MTTNLKELQPLNEEKFLEEFNTLEEDSRKEKISNILRERNEILDYNRKLYARSKEAEGFKQDDDGNWIKFVEKKSEEKSSKKDSVKSDDEVLKRLENMALKMGGITAEDEVGLFNKWKESTGREADLILENKIFQAELADLRTAKTNAEATTSMKGESSDSGAKGTPDYWIAKATKDSEGNLLFPEEMPNDYKLRSAIVEKLVGTSKDKRRFYNQK